jgi:superfamily II DNA or RNA helicase
MAKNGSAADPAPRVPAHPLLVDTDLVGWAGEGIARVGRKDALLGRVELLLLASDGRSIEARVRGNRPLPYRVFVGLDGDRLTHRCTCDRTDGTACRHAVAALEALRFPLTAVPSGPGQKRRRGGGRHRRGQGRVVQPERLRPGFVILGAVERSLTRTERIEQAEHDERALRKQRARRERADVAQINPPGEPPAFRVEGRSGRAPQTVVLRGERGKWASCTCDDFERNELGTCLHVERVRMWYLRKKKLFPERMLSLWAVSRPWPETVPESLREIRVDLTSEPFPESVTRYFGSDGWLRPPQDGVAPSRWAERAVDAVRQVAGERGWRIDQEAGVAERIECARADERRRGELVAVSPEHPVWRDVSSKLGLRLHAYQEHGARFLARTGRAFLADDMGLGKTIQAIAAALVLRRVAETRRALVVCPASLKYQWRREIERACGETVVVVEGPRSTRLAAYSSWTDGFLILNYELVLRDLEAIREANADLVILDEAQRIKNWNTKTARAVKQLTSRFAFVLTGTPLENRLLELHSLVEFLHPRALGPRWRLLPYHAVTEVEGRVIAYEGLDTLRGRLKGFFLRRERSQVLDQLPERTDNTFWTEMTPAQRRPYRHQASNLAKLVARRQPLTPGDVRLLLKTLTSMRILCNALAQYEWDKAFLERSGDGPWGPAALRALGSPKLEEFSDVLEDLLDESRTKIVVFSEWERMLRLAHAVVRGVLEARDLRAEVFHGGLSTRRRDDLLHSFRYDPEFRVLFSTDAGGLGLNLQDSASIVVNLEVPWNPAVLEQRIGRVHRLGQRRSVQVLHFVTRGAIEERVRQVLEAKRALFEGLLDSDVDHVVIAEAQRSSFKERVYSLITDG